MAISRVELSYTPMEPARTSLSTHSRRWHPNLDPQQLSLFASLATNPIQNPRGIHNDNQPGSNSPELTPKRGMWMKQRFQSRAAFLEERIETFLTTLTELGGYCTLEQAKRLELANSETRARMQLKALERLGFLRRVADYPVVYQIT
jgi:hypothetical protein